MAKQTKKTTQKSTAKQTVEKRSKQNKALEKSAKPIRREIGAAICLFLGIFTILSIFGVKSWFTTKLLAPFCKGLVGNAGFYILPASFFFSTFILLFHGGRPVRLRVTACFVMAGCIGAITHLFLDTVEIPWGISMVAALYRGGIAGTTGGLLCGFFSMLLELIFSKIGAVLIFVILLILSLLCALNMTIAGIAQAVKNRPKLEYDEPEEPQDNAAAVVNYVAQKHIDHVQKKRAADFDLPVDDPPRRSKSGAASGMSRRRMYLFWKSGPGQAGSKQGCRKRDRPGRGGPGRAQRSKRRKWNLLPRSRRNHRWIFWRLCPRRSRWRSPKRPPCSPSRRSRNPPLPPPGRRGRRRSRKRRSRRSTSGSRRRKSRSARRRPWQRKR